MQDGILKTLQNRIEEEEIHWQRELRAKEIEIENLEQNHSSEVNLISSKVVFIIILNFMF